ncbi:helix-turn-helix transcriptional regulator [Spiractinospora alimapuensis]|uniref:helix-turn-helix transcriptional regulator n=1 Tax=Spiractinospora alimapuensis TaxID=2820884 RepID=UPI001F34144D|nr:helix-turn-helix transcriptional regulator [Spiractinospora alimapuensis]QVQ53380.1 helix-turn-helix transcriptional regulator [Spiractinospora alimapuensis]
MAQRRHRLIELREGAAYTQEQLAHALGVEPSTVSRWERGTSIPKPGVRIRLSELFGVAQDRIQAIFNHSPCVSEDTGFTPASLVGKAPPWGGELVVPEIDVSGGGADVLHGELVRIAAEYVHRPLQDVALPLDELGRQTVDLLDIAPPSQLDRLRVIAGATNLLQAHAAQNRGRTSRAASYLTMAARFASESNSRALRAATHNTSALICEWIPGQEGTAVQHAAAAFELLPRGATGVRAAAIQARAAARCGDSDLALKALGRLARAREVPPHPEDLGVNVAGLFAFPEAKQAFYSGGTHRLLGHFHHAISDTRRALDLYSAVPPDQHSYGDEAIARVDLVGALVTSGADDEAATHLLALTELPPDMRIHQLHPAVNELGRVLIDRSSVSRPAQTMVELLHGFTVSPQ